MFYVSTNTHTHTPPPTERERERERERVCVIEKNKEVRGKLLASKVN